MTKIITRIQATTEMQKETNAILSTINSQGTYEGYVVCRVEETEIPQTKEQIEAKEEKEYDVVKKYHAVLINREKKGKNVSFRDLLIENDSEIVTRFSETTLDAFVVKLKTFIKQENNAK